MKRLHLIALLITTFVGFGSGRAWAQTVLPRNGWVATASDTNGGEPASRAIDGSASTRWSSGVNQTMGQWFSLDMITPQTFSEITIDPTSSTSDWTRGYQVFVSNDAVSWGNPVASGTGSPGILTILFPAQTARFVGIVQTGNGNNWWSIGEVNVYGPGATPQVALSTAGWAATASSSGSSDVPSHALDGTLSTRWTSGVPQSNGQWFQVDMLQSQNVRGVTINSDGSSSDYARAYQVYVSNDPNNWGGAVATGTARSSPIHVAFAATVGRYMRIVETGNASNWWSIAELTVYGVGTFAPVAMALPRTGWTATASASCSSDVPSNALDDNLATRFSTCALQISGMWFQVDMGQTQAFTQLTVDAGSNNGDYPQAYQVFASNDTSSWGSPIASGTGSGQVTTITFAYQNARFIRFLQIGASLSNWWSIHELNVYGVPPSILPRKGWQATASLNSSSAQSAIDGAASTRWNTGTNQVNGQWFQVDLLAPQSFTAVSLDATGSSGDYPRGYSVYVSNDGQSWGNLVASGIGTSASVLAGFPQATARYIRVVQTGYGPNWWSIYELNVWRSGASPCSATCVPSDSCHTSACNLATGTCANTPLAGSCTVHPREGRIYATTTDAFNAMALSASGLTPQSDSAWAQFNDVDFGAAGSVNSVSVNILGSPGNRHLEVHLDTPTGTLLADLYTLPSDVNPPVDEPQSTPLLPLAVSGLRRVVLVARTADIGTVAWFSFGLGNAATVISDFPVGVQHHGPTPILTGGLIASDSEPDVPDGVEGYRSQTPITIPAGQASTGAFTTTHTVNVTAKALWNPGPDNVGIMISDSQGHILALGTAKPGVASVTLSSVSPQRLSVTVINRNITNIEVTCMFSVASAQ